MTLRGRTAACGGSQIPSLLTALAAIAPAFTPPAPAENPAKTIIKREKTTHSWRYESWPHCAKRNDIGTVSNFPAFTGSGLMFSMLEE
jgi:hypothetical protein